MSGGTVIDSLIHKCGSSAGGGGIYMTGGEVVSCVISNNGASFSATASGGGVRMTGGTLRRSVVIGNQATITGGIHFQGGLVENCLVAGNSSTAADSVGGVQQSGGRLIHTTIAKNTTISTGVSGGMQVTGGTVTNTVSARNLRGSVASDFAGTQSLVAYSCAPGLTVANGNLADDPNFIDADAGNYRLGFPSMARDQGVAIAGILTDFTGGPRSIDGTGDDVAVPDMGAYEASTPESGEFAVTITTADPRTGLAPLGVTFEAVPVGVNTTITWYGWDINNDGEWNLQGSDLDTVTTNLPAGQYTITLQVTNAANAMARATITNMILAVGTDLYVSGSGSNVPPFATLGNAATNVAAALSMAIAGSIVNVDSGTFLVTEEFNINFPLTVRGLGAREDTIVARTGSVNFRPFRLSHAEAVLSSLTVTNGTDGGISMSLGTVSNVVVARSRGTFSSSNGGGISMSGGTVIDSLIHNCGSQQGGGGIYMTGGDVVSCVISNNGPVFHATASGGGVRMTGGTLRRSVVIGNQASITGGIHLQGGLVENCLVVSNSTTAASSVGGIQQSGGQLVHTTVVNNSTPATGAAGGMTASGGSVTNSIIWSNLRGTSASDFQTGGDTYARYSCAPELTPGVNGNINSYPQFETVNGVPYHLAVGSLSIDAGTNLTSIATDLAGAARIVDGNGDGIAVADMGAYEALEIGDDVFIANIQTLSPVSGLAPLEVVLQAHFVGGNTEITWYGWDLNNDGEYDPAGVGLGIITNSFSPGRYTITLSATNALGMGATVTASNLVSAITTNIFVSSTGDNVFPYHTLQKATTNLSEALNMALSGSVVHLDSGTYFVDNQYTLNQPMTVRGIGAREDAVVAGTWIRQPWSVFRVNHEDALLCSVTVSNGIGDQVVGGGIRLDAGIVTNVLITHSVAQGSQSSGGGVYMTGGLLIDSEIAHGSASGSGDHGGGALYITGGEAVLMTIRDNGLAVATRHGAVRLDGGALRRSVVTQNAGTHTGGIRITGSSGLIENCLIVSNVTTAADSDGGGVSMTAGRLINTTVADNTVPATGAAGGIHATGGAVTNTIAWGNLKGGDSSDFPAGDTYARYSLAPELTPGAPNNNLNGNPLFEGDGSYRLALGSPAINAGTNLGWTTGDKDLAGDPRIRMAVVDMGCFEAVPPAGTLILLR